MTLLAREAGIARQAAERFHALIEFAAALGAPLVTVGSFRGRLAWAGRHARIRLIEILKAAAVKAAEVGVRLALEPLNRYESDVINNASEGLALIE
jgi:sugar phosphate isomerase/epimerase